MPELDPRVEAAARALWNRDCKRSVGLGAAHKYWDRVAPEYRRAAQAALEAADRVRPGAYIPPPAEANPDQGALL